MLSALTSPLKRLFESKLLGQVAVVGTFTVGVKAVGFTKELVVAYSFGTSDVVDAFVVALLVPTMLAVVVGDAFHDSAIPVFSKVRISGRAGADRLISNVFWICAATLLVASMLTVLFGGSLLGVLAREFSPEKQALSVGFLWMLLPFAVCFGIGNILRGYLQAHGQFSVSSVAPALVPLSTILFLLAAPKPPPSAFLAIGVSVGALLFLAVLIMACSRTSGGRLIRRPGWDAETGSVVRHAIPLLAGAAIMEGCFFVDTLMAASLPSGSVATLSYGARICNLVLAIAGTAAGQVLFPHVSKLVAEEAWKPLTRVVVRFSTSIVLAALPFVGFFWIASEPVVRILLERGEFTPEDTVGVAAVLRLASFQIPGYILAVLGARVVMALRGNRFMLLSTIITLGLNVVLNLLFIPMFGVAGIALSTALVLLCSAAMLFSYVGFRVRRLSSSGSVDKKGDN